MATPTGGAGHRFRRDGRPGRTARPSLRRSSVSRRPGSPASTARATVRAALPAPRERRSGDGEMAKYHFLTGDDLAAMPLTDRVARCVAIKAEVAQRYRDFFAGTDVRFVEPLPGDTANFWLNAIVLGSEAERDAKTPEGYR